jgi:hypothetical protein
MAYIERCAAPELTGRHVFLAALHCCAPSAADPSSITLRGELHFPSGSNRSVDTLVRSLVSRFPRITSLRCSHPHALGDVGLTAVADTCANLQSLDVTCVPGTPASSLLAIARKCPALATLGLHASPEMTSALEAIGTACPTLSTLSLSDSVAREVNLASAARCFPNLTHLNLTFNRARCIDSVVVAFAKNCPRLEMLDLFGSTATTAGVSAVAQMCPRIQRFDASNPCKRHGRLPCG